MGDNRYISGLLNNDYHILQEIYEAFSKPIIQYVLKNSGQLEDAKDVFQEGLIIMYNKAQSSEFELTSSFETYLYSVCRFIWLKKLNKKSKKAVTFLDSDVLMDVGNTEEESVDSIKHLIFDLAFSKITPECKKVLQMYFDKKSGSEIAKDMQYSVEYVKRKKYKCKQKLIELVKSDSRYRETFE